MSKQLQLFGSSGIRGKYNEKITPQLAIKVGLAVAEAINNTGLVIVGHDHRTTSPLLYNATIAGLNAGGVEVLGLGLSTTPTTAYGAQIHKAKAAITITASHNPPEYNGMKLWNPDGQGFTVEQQIFIENVIAKNSIRYSGWSKIPSTNYTDASKDHQTAIIKALDLPDIGKNRKKVLVDSGWGTGSLVTPQVYSEIGLHTISLNCPPNGINYTKFCGKIPDNISPQQKAAIAEWQHFINIVDFVNIMKATKANFGVAHDGDADRVLAIDEKGQIVSGDQLLAVFSQFFLSRKSNRGKPVVTTVSASLLIDKIAEQYGSQVDRVKVGDVFVSTRVKETKAVFGGEPTGPYVFPDIHYCPDGPLSAGVLYSILENSDQTLNQIIAQFETYPIKRENLQCPDSKKTILMEKILTNIQKEFSGVKNINQIDGIRATFEDHSWFLIRPSGTEPVIRVTVEAIDKSSLTLLSNKIMAIIKKHL